MLFKNNNITLFLDLLQVDLLASGATFQINPLSTSLIPDQPLLREIYNEHPIISYKRAKSLGDILGRTKL